MQDTSHIHVHVPLKKALCIRIRYTEAQRATIADKKQQLADVWASVHASADERRAALAAALEVQQYLADAAETHALLEKKLVVVSSTDYGTGEGSVSLLTKHNNEVPRDVCVR